MELTWRRERHHRKQGDEHSNLRDRCREKHQTTRQAQCHLADGTLTDRQKMAVARARGHAPDKGTGAKRLRGG